MNATLSPTRDFVEFLLATGVLSFGDFTTKSGPDSSGKGGTGLGLAMCREIIEAHQGRIRVESTVGKGTAFTLKLPVAAKPAPLAPTLPVPPLPVVGLPLPLLPLADQNTG